MSALRLPSGYSAILLGLIYIAAFVYFGAFSSYPGCRRARDTEGRQPASGFPCFDLWRGLGRLGYCEWDDLYRRPGSVGSPAG